MVLLLSLGHLLPILNCGAVERGALGFDAGFRCGVLDFDEGAGYGVLGFDKQFDHVKRRRAHSSDQVRLLII
jgi:hypothetical protein